MSFYPTPPNPTLPPNSPLLSCQPAPMPPQSKSYTTSLFHHSHVPSHRPTMSLPCTVALSTTCLHTPLFQSPVPSQETPPPLHYSSSSTTTPPPSRLTFTCPFMWYYPYVFAFILPSPTRTHASPLSCPFTPSCSFPPYPPIPRHSFVPVCHCEPLPISSLPSPLLFPPQPPPPFLHAITTPLILNHAIPIPLFQFASHIAPPCPMPCLIHACPNPIPVHLVLPTFVMSPSWRYFWIHIVQWKCINCCYDFTEVYSQVSNQQYYSIGSENGLAQAPHAIFWTIYGYFTDASIRHWASRS